jgi:hypothetical protein
MQWPLKYNPAKYGKKKQWEVHSALKTHMCYHDDSGWGYLGKDVKTCFNARFEQSSIHNFDLHEALCIGR